MPMEGRVDFSVPKTTLEFHREKGVSVIFQTLEINGDQDSNI